MLGMNRDHTSTTEAALGLGSVGVEEEVLGVVQECVDQTGVCLGSLFLLLLGDVDLNSAWVEGCPPWWVCRMVKLF